jgi:methyl-accepting chemotaxis protein
MSSAGDMNGFLPTHITECSRAPTGDIEHDTAHCRNGRLLYDETDAAAKRSTAPFFMTVYRQEGDGINICDGAQRLYAGGDQRPPLG